MKGCVHVRGVLQSPRMPCQAEPSYLEHKTPQEIRTAVRLSAWCGEEGSCAKRRNFCPLWFMREEGLAPACGASAISAASNGSWLCSLSPQSCVGLALPQQPGGFLAGRAASTACDAKLCGHSCGLWFGCPIPAWLCAVFSVEHVAPQGRMHEESLRTSCLGCDSVPEVR